MDNPHESLRSRSGDGGIVTAVESVGVVNDPVSSLPLTVYCCAFHDSVLHALPRRPDVCRRTCRTP